MQTDAIYDGEMLLTEEQGDAKIELHDQECKAGFEAPMRG